MATKHFYTVRNTPENRWDVQCIGAGVSTVIAHCYEEYVADCFTARLNDAFTEAMDEVAEFWQAAVQGGDE